MYKNRFLTSLRKVLVVGIVCSVNGIAGFLVGLILAPSRFNSHKKESAETAQVRFAERP